MRKGSEAQLSPTASTGEHRHADGEDPGSCRRPLRDIVARYSGEFNASKVSR